MAEVLNLPEERFAECAASGPGAAMVGATAMGWYTSIEAAGTAMLGDIQCTSPNPQNAERYQAIYQNTYLPLYAKLKPLFEWQLT